HDRRRGACARTEHRDRWAADRERHPAQRGGALPARARTVAKRGSAAACGRRGTEREPMMRAARPRIGVFGIGLAAYWPQFEGLRERLEGYQQGIESKLEQ